MVISSWLTFWMKKTEMIARIMLTSVIFFTFVCFMTITNTSFTPETGSTTSLDIYLLISLSIIFTTLYLNVHTSHVIGNIEEETQSQQSKTTESSEVKSNYPRALYAKYDDDPSIRFLDKLGSVLLPAVFVVFNLTYWIICSFCPILFVWFTEIRFN